MDFFDRLTLVGLIAGFILAGSGLIMMNEDVGSGPPVLKTGLAFLAIGILSFLFGG